MWWRWHLLSIWLTRIRRIHRYTEPLACINSQRCQPFFVLWKWNANSADHRCFILISAYFQSSRYLKKESHRITFQQNLWTSSAKPSCYANGITFAGLKTNALDQRVFNFSCKCKQKRVRKNLNADEHKVPCRKQWLMAHGYQSLAPLLNFCIRRAKVLFSSRKKIECHIEYCRHIFEVLNTD